MSDRGRKPVTNKYAYKFNHAGKRQTLKACASVEKEFSSGLFKVRLELVFIPLAMKS